MSLTRSQTAGNKDLRDEISKNSLPYTSVRTLKIANTSNQSVNKSSESLLANSESPFREFPEVMNPEDNILPQPVNRVVRTMTVSLKDALRVVPEYDGLSVPLSVFLEGCGKGDGWCRR